MADLPGFRTFTLERYELRAMGSDSGRSLVSTILITRDRPRLFSDAIESVLEQSYPDIELVVVDGSRPSIRSVLEERTEDSAIDSRYLRDENEGAAAARNLGIRAANGEFLAFLDDDDCWLRTKIERQVEAFQQGDESLGLVYTGQRVERDGERIGGRTPTLEGTVTRDILCGKSLCPTSTVMVRAEAVEAAGAFDPQFPVMEDREWYLRLSRHYEFEPIPEPLMIRAEGSHEQLTDDFEALRDVTYPRFLEKHRSLAAKYGPTYERRFVAHLSFTVGASALGHGHVSDARRYLANSIRHRPLSLKPYLYLLLSLGDGAFYAPVRRLKRGYERLQSSGN